MGESFFCCRAALLLRKPSWWKIELLKRERCETTELGPTDRPIFLPICISHFIADYVTLAFKELVHARVGFQIWQFSKSEGKKK